MAYTPLAAIPEESGLGTLLQRYSVELTARDSRSLDELVPLLPAATEVFVANLPNESADVLVAACARLREAGLVAVPHIVARNVASVVALEAMVSRLAGEAGVDRALVLGGDRDRPAGTLDSALQIIETGLLQKYGIRRIALACYPEGHPRISNDVLDAALAAKLATAQAAGLDVSLVSQFLFDPEPLIAFATRLRLAGITAPLRVGVAGPADRGKLFKYALRCGVGASLRALKERGNAAKGILSGETPEALLRAVAQAQQDDPTLGIAGVHFFTFGDPAKSVRWAEDRR